MPTFTPPNDFTVSIELAESLLDVAIKRATEIEQKNREDGRRNVQGNTYSPEKSLELRIRGYAGEAALATHLGRPVPRHGDHWQNRPDVGGYDVMCTNRLDGRLIFTPRQPLWSVKVLVIDQWPVFHIVGCYLAADAHKHYEWWKEPRPGGGAWFVPQEELRPVNEGDDVRPIDDRDRKALDHFSRDWRQALHAAGVDQPKPSPLAKAVTTHPVQTGPVSDIRNVIDHAVVNTIANEEYGSTNRATYNPHGLVVRTDVPPHLQTYHPREEP